MADRKQQIILLWGARFDFDWFPNGSLKTTSGFAPSAKVACPGCGAGDTPGVQTDRFDRAEPCGVCGGRPATERRAGKRGRGYVYVDEMDTLRRPLGHRDTRAAVETAEKPGRRVMCDRCGGDGVWKGERCELCNGAGHRDQHLFNLRLQRTDLTDLTPEPGDDLAAAIDRRNQQGSFAELERAAARICRTVNKPVQYIALTHNALDVLRLLDDLYLPPATRELRDLSSFEHALVDLALEYIDELMPDPIRVPAGLAQNARERREQLRRVRGRSAPRARETRDDVIRRLIREGRASAWVAREYGLSVSQVNRIVGGEAA